ncbi:MAG: hypothetical protein QNJ46_18090 [Leptolyngbyaceae cyanobacterium MO_188.B28]|nr:hypothetical protein [Leptolyngbyaceae cyanobacterium MO_188.B28]
MKETDLPVSQDIDRLKLFIYLVPVFGFFPALLSLYRRKGSQQELAISRLAVLLALGWLVAYSLLGTGAQLSEGFSLRLLITSSLLTTGYFLTNLWLIIRLWRRKSVRLPGISNLSDRLP